MSSKRIQREASSTPTPPAPRIYIRKTVGSTKYLNAKKLKGIRKAKVDCMWLNWRAGKMKKSNFRCCSRNEMFFFFSGHVISPSLNKLVQDGWIFAFVALLTAISQSQKSKKRKWSITLYQSRHFHCDPTIWRFSLFAFRKRRELREARNQ